MSFLIPQVEWRENESEEKKMENLKVIENELVPVYETSTGEKVVYGSELHKVLEVKSNYREWIKRRFAEIDAVEKENFDSVEISTVVESTPKKERNNGISCRIMK